MYFCYYIIGTSSKEVKTLCLKPGDAMRSLTTVDKYEIEDQPKVIEPFSEVTLLLLFENNLHRFIFNFSELVKVQFSFINLFLVIRV